MRKLSLILFVFVIASMLCVPAFAEDAAPIEAPVEAPAEAPVEAPVEAPAEEVAPSFADQAAAWVREYADKLIVIVTAIYAVFPKVGLLPILVNILGKLKSKFDDDNPNAVHKVVAANASTISEFMTDIAPLLEEMRAYNVSAQEVLNKVLSDKERAEKVAVACVEAMKLMGKELNDLVSCSTTISAKTKACIENEWRAANDKIEALLAGDDHDDQA